MRAVLSAFAGSMRIAQQDPQENATMNPSTPASRRPARMLRPLRTAVAWAVGLALALVLVAIVTAESILGGPSATAPDLYGEANAAGPVVRLAKAVAAGNGLAGSQRPLGMLGAAGGTVTIALRAIWPAHSGSTP